MTLNIKGKRFGRLIVIESIVAKPRRKWRCICDCGNEITIETNRLTSGNTRSCGCYQKEFSSINNRKHGLHGIPEYGIWAGMIQRCTNPNHTVFSYYGGKGVTVCDRWLDFANFFSDMGPRPTKQHSIDRIDSNSGYEPSNCKWATRKTQLENRSCSRNYEFNGVTKSLSDWARHIGINKSSLRERIDKWGVDRALSTPKLK